jgi:hypothetical protein
MNKELYVVPYGLKTGHTLTGDVAWGWRLLLYMSG